MSYRTAYTRKLSLACAPGRNRLDRVLQAGELLHRLKLRGDPFGVRPPVARLDPNLLNQFEYIADVFLDVLDLDKLIQIRQLALTSNEWNALFKHNEYEWVFVKEKIRAHFINKSDSDFIVLKNYKYRYSIYDIYNTYIMYELTLAPFKIPFQSDEIKLELPQLHEDNANMGILMGAISFGTFKKLKLLTVIGLGKNDVSQNMVVAFANAIKPTNIPLLQTLTIDESDLRNLVVLYNAIAELHVLSTLTIRSCNIDLSGMTAFLNTITPTDGMMTRLAKLSTLNLDNNEIGDEIMIEFSNAVQAPKLALASLRCLNLSQNLIGDRGITRFSEALEGGALDKLEVLKIDDNTIGHSGLIKFASAIASGKPAYLKSLSLNQQTPPEGISQINVDSMNQFARALTTRKGVTGGSMSIKVICVDDGPLGTDHIELKGFCHDNGIELV